MPQFNLWEIVAVISIVFAILALPFGIGYKYGTYKEHQAGDKRVAEAQKADKEHEIKNQNITIGASNVYQSGLNTLNNDLSNVMREQTCVSINTSSPPSGRNATDKPKEPGYRDAINPNELYRFAGECEKDRLKVIALQKLIVDERK